MLVPLLETGGSDSQSAMRYSKADQTEARERLLKLLKPGDKVFTILRSVSRSGMSRNIDLYLLEKDEKVYLTYSVAALLEYPRAKDGSLKVGGCGMDMGYHIVHSLARVLYGDNFYCIGENCPSNDHVNGEFDRSKKNIGRKHSDGGYSLKHEWL